MHVCSTFYGMPYNHNHNHNHNHNRKCCSALSTTQTDSALLDSRLSAETSKSFRALRRAGAE